MRNFRNNKLNKPVNYVLKSFVDKDVMAMLFPFHLMQFLTCSPRYRIKNNCISPNNTALNLYSIIGPSLIISLYIFRAYKLFYYRNQWGLTTFTNASNIFDCIYYSIGFIINIVSVIVHTKNYIKFVLLFQRVHRLLSHGKSYNLNFIVWSWILFVIDFSGYFFAVPYFTSVLFLPWYYLTVFYFVIIFDFNVIYATRYLKLLEDKLTLLNLLVLNSIVTERTRGEDFSKGIFQAYVDILECYKILNVCFQPFILYNIVELFLHSLIYVEVIIEQLKESFRDNTIYFAALGSLSVLCWLVKNLIFEAMFMQQCHTFYLAVQSVRDSCALILKSRCSDNEKRMYKNVLRIHRASFSKMRVCGLFYADAALQLSLMSLLANYTIVILQFAFL